jgi:hypothetical protein
MNVRRSLENRLRGWFPQEPYLFSRGCNVVAGVKNPPLKIRQEYTNSATKNAGVLAIGSTIFVGLFLLSLNLEWQPFSIYYLVAWIIAGAIIGMVLCTLYTSRELCRLSRDYQIDAKWKENLLIVMLPFIVFLIGTSLAMQQIALTSGAAMFSLYAWMVSFEFTRYGSLRLFEKKENMRIMTSWFGPGYAAIPQPPKQKMSLKQVSELRLP